MTGLTLFFLYWLVQNFIHGRFCLAVGYGQAYGGHDERLLDNDTWANLFIWLLAWTWPFYLLWLACGRPRA